MPVLVDADAFPDGPGHWSARVTSAKVPAWEAEPDHLHDVVGQMTCAAKGDRWRLPGIVAGLVACAADLDEEDEVYVRLHWRERDPLEGDLA